MQTEQPNIVFIFTDQLRADSIGVPAESPVITPNLNRIAAEGTTFTRFMSNSPLCVPARAAIMTGQLPRENGVWSNRLGADPSGPSHVRNIRDVGYHTAVIGKTHLWRDGPTGKPGRHVREREDNLTAWGFEFSQEVNDPIGTRNQGCNYTDYLEGNGWLDAHRDYINAWVLEMRTGNVRPWDQRPAPVPRGEDIDSYIGRSAVEWLRRYEADIPFYLQIQFTGPHDPFDAPAHYRELYDPGVLDPGLMHPHSAPLPTIESRQKRFAAVFDATREQRQRWRAWYYANITLIDDWIGQVLGVLNDRGQLDNTWIIFNSDHGEMLGDHGLWGKAVFYKEAVRVPCIVRPPTGSTASGCHRLVQHIDLPVTMIDIAGARPLANTLGRSLLDDLDKEKPPTPDNDFVISELFGQATVITDRLKLTAQLEDLQPVQLFDLNTDPNELQNVVVDPQYSGTIRDLTELFLRPLEVRTDGEKFADYRHYVNETGSRN